MRFFLAVAAFLFFAGFSLPSWACAAPDFPVPDEVRLVQLKKTDKELLTSADYFLLESYDKDRKRYLEVYEEIFPCSLYGDRVVPSDLPGDRIEALKQELVLLERKWGQQGATEENRAAEEEFTDVSDEEFTAIE